MTIPSGAGWAVYAPDHRGHGKTASRGELGRIPEGEGFRRVVEDLREVVTGVCKGHGAVPVAMFGHCGFICS